MPTPFEYYCLKRKNKTGLRRQEPWEALPRSVTVAPSSGVSSECGSGLCHHEKSHRGPHRPVHPRSLDTNSGAGRGAHRLRRPQSMVFRCAFRADVRTGRNKAKERPGAPLL